MQNQMVKTFFLTVLSLSSVLAFGSGNAEKPKSYYHEAQFMVNRDNCTSTYKQIETDALYICELEHPKCKIKDRGTISIEPVTNPQDRALGWKNTCTVFSIATEVIDTKDALEAGLGLGGQRCKSGAGQFNTLIMRLGFKGNVQAYSRCDYNNEILFGVKAESTPGSINAGTPILFKNMDDCLKALHGGLSNFGDSKAVSVATSRFSVSLFCEPVGWRKARLTGIINLF